MARPPQPLDRLIDQYGPHLQYAPPGGWGAAAEAIPERLVKTHCCFCGQQCGIQLKVRENQVVGFEPWYEFPFNRGMLCPKGVKRYLQNGHPDRLLSPLIRSENGFRQAGWDEALDLAVREMQRIQTTYGKAAMAVFGGSSLITEKTYLIGKFARVALGTPHIDYNGRLCMSSAAVGYKKAFGVDRAPNPWADIPEAEVLLVVGANIGECAPITTDYVWRCRDNGGRLIVVDPRITPIARNADLFLPVRPGTDVALLQAMLHVLIRDDLIDRPFIAAHTEGFEEAAESVRAMTPEAAGRLCGVAPQAIEKAAHWYGQARTGIILHARGLEHQSKGVYGVLGVTNLALATGKIGREGAGCMMITGQGNGQGGREHGQKADQLPGQRNICDEESRRQVASVWGIAPDDLPGVGLSAVEIVEAIHRGEIKGLLSICFNPMVSLPDSAFTQEALNRLEFFGVIDFFLSESAHHADVVLAGSLHEEEEGMVTTLEGRVVHIRKATDPPANAWPDTRIICELARRLGKGDYFPFQVSTDILDELRAASRGGPADYTGITYEKMDRQMGVFWPCPSLDHSGTPRLFEGGRFFYPDGKARFFETRFLESGDPLSADFPLFLTTGRVVSQYLSGTQTRRIGPLVDQYPEPRVEMHPDLANRYGVKSGDWVTVTTRRGEAAFPALVVKTIRSDTVFIPYHWPGSGSANQLTHRTLDPVSKIPEFKVSACRLAKGQRPADWVRHEELPPQRLEGGP